MASAVAIRVLLGTQSVRTADPADTVPVDDRDVRTELGCDEGGLVSSGATADDHDSGSRHASIVSH